MNKILIALSVAALVPFVDTYAQTGNEDWARHGTYSEANSQVVTKPKAVFLGDSITEGWANKDKEFFSDNNFIGRGISGQTSSQILCRMQEDVVSLHPKYVVILCGINDIAWNDGYAYTLETVAGNIKSMCEIAKANKIRPVLCSLLPSYKILWRTEVPDVEKKIAELNAILKDYAKANGIRYADYYTLLADGNNRIRSEYSNDTVHPLIEGYKVMEEYILKFLK